MTGNRQYGTYLVFDGLQSNEYGVWISGTGTYDAPEYDQEFVTIPGRSGDLIRDNGRWNNIEITYPAFISRGFDRLFDVFKAAMLSRAGAYRRLEDTYHPGEYRMASFLGAMQPETGPYNRSGRFSLAFQCKPQRYLKSGEQPTALSASGFISNPTPFASRPLIRVYGAGVLGVGAVTVTIASNAFPYIDIDCEAMDARYGASNANGYITLSGDDFPSLAPGETGVALGAGISKVILTPRWWVL